MDLLFIRQVKFLPWLDFHILLTCLKVYVVYNSLFNHIEDSQRHLENKQLPWKKQLYKGLGAAHKKLSEYYGRTYEFQGVIYAIGTILDPCQKLSVFTGTSWTNDDSPRLSWVVRYEQVFRQVYTYYQSQFPTTSEAITPVAKLNEIDQALHNHKRRRYNQRSDTNNHSQYHRYPELQKYLEDECQSSFSFLPLKKSNHGDF